MARPLARPATSSTSIERIDVDVYRMPTDGPESDGTLTWEATTMVAVHLSAAGCTGFGYTYGDGSLGRLVADTLAPVLDGADALDLPRLRRALLRAMRNLGVPGAGAMALSAIDTALWDLKAKLLDVSLQDLWGAARDSVPLYASGGFTNYDDARLEAQLAGWRERGFAAAKIKIGSDPARDPARVALARRTLGDDVRLMVDANGALDRKQALAMAERLVDSDVRWFEEPVSSDDLDGLRLLRDRVPAAIEIAAGEYGWDAAYFERMLVHGAVDVLQADGSRCGGYSGLFDVDALCRAHGLPLSLHCVPALHAPVAAALGSLRDLEYFHDHARLESRLLDGLPTLCDGELSIDRSRPGHGLVLRRRDAERWRV